MAVKKLVVVNTGQLEQIQSGDTVDLPNGSTVSTQAPGTNNTTPASTAFVTAALAVAIQTPATGANLYLFYNY